MGQQAIGYHNISMSIQAFGVSHGVWARSSCSRNIFGISNIRDSSHLYDVNNIRINACARACPIRTCLSTNLNCHTTPHKNPIYDYITTLEIRHHAKLLWQWSIIINQRRKKKKKNLPRYPKFSKGIIICPKQGSSYYNEEEVEQDEETEDGYY